MNHIKEIKKENGDKVLIYVSFWLNHHTPIYRITIAICPKGKRKFKGINFDGYDYRALPMPDKIKYEESKILEIVPIEFINQAKLELHELLKP